jgi:hypothetical protein
LAIFDKNHVLRAAFGVGTDDTPRAAFYDSRGRTRAGMSVEADDSSRLDLFDTKGEFRLSLVVGVDGVPTLSLHGSPDATVSIYQDGTRRIGLGVVSEGRPLLAMTDRKGGLRTGLAVDTDGAPGQSFYDENRRPLWSAPPKRGG